MYYIVIIMTASVCLRLPETVVSQLDAIAESTERSKSYLIRKAIEQYLSEYVDYQIALDRLNDLNDEIISSKELRKQLADKN